MTSEDLAQDLALVFGEATLRPQLRPTAYHLGQPMDWHVAVTQAGHRIAQSSRPAFVGLHPLTIESLRSIVTLAQQTRGSLLPRPVFDSPLRLTQPVAQLGTLGHLMSCDLILGIGVKRNELPVKLQQSKHVFEALPESLQVVLDLATAVHDRFGSEELSHPFARLLTKHQSIGVVLCADCDERVAAQWHRLAGVLQNQTRMAILAMPHFEALNARGVEAVIAWRTACSVAAGGVDFGSGIPKSCPAWRAMIQPSSEIDLIIDTSLYPLAHQSDAQLPDVIRIASSPLPHALYSFVVPDMSAGMAGHVMRFDGVILKLASDATRAFPDLTTALLNELLQTVCEAQGQS